MSVERKLGDLARLEGRTLDGVIVAGLVVSAVFATRSKGHFLPRGLGAAFLLTGAGRLWRAARQPRPKSASVAPATNSTLVSIVAHEIRAPITAIRGAVALLEEHDGALDRERRTELYSVALEATKQLAHLADDLLLVSRIAGGRLRVENQVFDIVEVVHEATDAAMTHRISVVEQPAVPHVAGDPMRVRQVVTNLLSNAVANATQDSMVLVAIARADTTIRVTIYNEGRGIPPEEQSRLFLPFASVNERRIDSTGLGLYIAKELVEAMGGTIGFDTQPGHNAAFWFTLEAASA